MNARYLVLLGACASLLSAQTYQRQATITGGGSANSGKCTAEVIVDGAADVEISGNRATLRNLSGQPAQWRRFECTGVMPQNPADFRFAGVDGRGRQQLIRDPRNGGIAVVRLEDPDGGSEGYTFDIMWGGDYRGGDFVNPGGIRRVPDSGPGVRGNFSAREAVAHCQDEVRIQAADRYRLNNVSFLRTVMDDNPGRRDWVTGSFLARRRMGRSDTYNFSCAVNLNNGNVRSVDIQLVNGPSGFQRSYGASPASAQAINSCEQAVAQRLRRDGFPNVDFTHTGVDDNPGRRDWIVGDVRAGGNGQRDWFTFSCAVNLNNGNVRSVQVERR